MGNWRNPSHVLVVALVAGDVVVVVVAAELYWKYNEMETTTVVGVLA